MLLDIYDSRLHYYSATIVIDVELQKTKYRVCVRVRRTKACFGLSSIELGQLPIGSWCFYYFRCVGALTKSEEEVGNRVTGMLVSVLSVWDGAITT